MLELGKQYNWSDITEEYPDMYAIVTDIQSKDGMIQSCKLLEVVSYDKEEEAICKYMRKGIKFACERTTFSAPNVGVLY